MKSPYVLLVEDNADDELLIQRAFKKNDIQVAIKVVHDGVEALEFLVGNSSDAEHVAQDLPQIILLDLSLPRMSGLELLQRLRQNPRTKSIPVIVLTSSKEDEDIVRAYEYGANSYVTKPVDFSELSNTIKQLGLYWLHLNQPLPARYMKPERRS